MLFLKKTLPILLAVFVLSVIVRLPQLNRPLAKHHEFCTAVSLRVLEIWNKNGITPFKANPVMNYGNPADKFINNHANTSGKMLDKKGNYYYVSHPPFAYYFPYFVFKILNIKPTVLSLQILNLCLHFLSALFVYFTVLLLSFKQARNNLHFSSFVAYCIYLFMPTTLWFQGNIYMSDMAVHLPYIIGVYTVLKMIIRQRFHSYKYQILYAFILGMMIYTSWLGVFFAFGVLVYALIHVRQIKGFRILIINTLFISFLTLRLISFQYAQINGLLAYAEEAITRYLVRGSIAETSQGYFHFIFSYLYYFKTLLFNYFINYLPFYIIIVGFFIFSFSKKKMKITFTENGYRFLWLSILPIVLLHLIFLNYSVHDFTTLYASLFFSVLSGIIYDKIKKSGNVSPQKLNTIYLFLIGLMLVQYTAFNLPGDKSIKGFSYDTYQKAGAFIATNSSTDEVLFMYDEPTPEIVLYAHRNIKHISTEAEAFSFLKFRNLKKGVIFEGKIENNFQSFKTKKIILE